MCAFPWIWWIALFASVYDIVPVPPAETKIPLPDFDPESAVPSAPIVLFAKKVFMEGVPLFALALNSVTALPLASRIVLFVTWVVIVPLVARTRFPPPMMLFGLLFDSVLPRKATSIVVLPCPVKFALSETQLLIVLPSPAFVPPKVVLITTPLLTRASTATHWLPSEKFCMPPNVFPFTVRFVVPAVVLTSEKSLARPPLTMLLVSVTLPVVPFAVALPKWIAPSP